MEKTIKQEHFLKSLLITSLLIFSFSSFSSAVIKNPPRQGKGFENINKRMEYTYYGHEDEKIWHEFGRPFWNSKKDVPKKAMIKQVTSEKRAATLRKVSKNYDPVKKTLTLDVKFELNKASIQQDYTAAINRLGEALKGDKTLSIEIQGHTDTTGSLSLNNNLSSSRAQSVKEYLMNEFGISSERLKSKGYGPSQPVASNETFDGRKQNRRVDIKVLK